MRLSILFYILIFLIIFLAHGSQTNLHIDTESLCPMVLSVVTFVSSTRAITSSLS